MNDDGERDLHERFGRLREEDAGAAPGFRGLLQRPVGAGVGRRPAARSGLLLLAAAVLAGVVVSVARNRRAHPGYEIDLSSTTWHGPTDFLLVTLDDETLRSVPRLGELELNWRTP